jgi:hypothetical protein
MQAAHGLRAVLVLPKSLREARIGALRLESAAQVREAFGPFERYPIIQMDGFYRSPIERPVALSLSPKLESFARRLAQELLGKRYMAVQWRSETVTRERWDACVNTVAEVIARVAYRLRFSPRQVLFLSDVFPDTSDTDTRGKAARDLAIGEFERKLPGMMTHPIHGALGMIADSGIKAITEQFLAVNAPYFFAASLGESNDAPMGACAKPGSGFVETIVREREKRGLKSFPLLHIRVRSSSGKQLERFDGVVVDSRPGAAPTLARGRG